MDSQTTIIQVELSDGTVVNVEATSIGEVPVAYQSLPFKEVKTLIKNITHEIAETLQSVKQETQADKLSIKLGLEVAIESGQLTALIVKGSSKANFELTLEWGN